MDVVVVAESNLVADGLSSMLSHADHVVTTRVGPPDAVADLLARRGAAACVVEIDPGVARAREALGALRRDAPAAWIVVLVARLDPEFAGWAAARRIDRVLLRSARKDELLAAVDRHPSRRLARQAASTDRRTSLSPSERRVLSGLCVGADTHTIATTLGISDSTVRSHVRAIFAKLGVRSRVAAVIMATSLGLCVAGPFEAAWTEQRSGHAAVVEVVRTPEEGNGRHRLPS